MQNNETTETQDAASLPVTKNDMLVSFSEIPIGHRMRYPGTESVWTIVEKRRYETNDEPMSGTIAEYVKDSMQRPSMCSHMGGSEDCPDMVIMVD